MRGYDEFNTILLPPRSPGEELPKELFDAYNEMRQKKEEAENVEFNRAEEVQVAESNVSIDEMHQEPVMTAASRKFEEPKSEEEFESEKGGRIR